MFPIVRLCSRNLNLLFVEGIVRQDFLHFATAKGRRFSTYGIIIFIFVVVINSTLHRAHLSRDTHANFSRVHVAQNVWGILLCAVCVYWKPFHLIHVSLHFIWHIFHHFLYTVFYTCVWFVCISFFVKPVDESIHCQSAFGSIGWRIIPHRFWAQPKSLIRVSSDTHIPIISYLRRGSLDANADEFATILGASEVCDKSNVGQLISPLFSQKREVSVIPRRIQVGESQARCWAVFSLRETVFERYKISRFRECAGFPNGKA